MDRDPALVEREQDRLGLDAVDPAADDAGQPGDRVAVERDPVGATWQFGTDPVGVRSGGFRFRADRAGELLGGGAEAHDGGDVLDPTPTGPLLHAADHERGNAQSAADEQCAGALGSAPRVRGDAHQVRAERGEVDRDGAGGRARVDVDEHPAFARATRTRPPRAGACRPRGSRVAP